MNISEQIPFINYNDKEKNYAFVINLKQNHSQGQILNMNKGQRIKGFYDDLINYDYHIKKRKNEISHNKISCIKELVYSDKQIPQTWKNKITYYKDCCKSLSSDKNFIAYLGKGNEYSNSKKKKKLLSINSFQTEESPHDFRTYSTGALPIKRNNLNHKPNRQSIQRISVVGFNLNNSVYNNDERKIKSIFEDMRMKYPLEIALRKREKELKKECLNVSIISNNDKGNKDKTNIRKNNEDKIKILQSTMYSHLLSSHNIKTTPVNNKPKIKKICSSLYLNYNADEFYNIPDIKSKQIDNKLKDINYYGPHFSYCPPCRKKNNSFYNEMETEQCITLLNYLKSQKRKI